MGPSIHKRADMRKAPETRTGNDSREFLSKHDITKIGIWSHKYLSISHLTQGEHLLALEFTNVRFWPDTDKPHLRLPKSLSSWRMTFHGAVGYGRSNR